MLFVDTNIFIYSVGRDHPYKSPSLHFLSSVAEGKEKIVISAEVLQEILYRFWSIRRMKDGFELFEQAVSLSEMVLPIFQETTKKAKELLRLQPDIGPRDAFHVATMLENKISTIVSYDRHFDLVKDIKRIEPEGD